MAEEIAVENCWISKFKGLVTLTLDRVIMHTVVHHSSTSTYTPNFNETEETFGGRTYIQTDGHLRPTSLSRLRRVDLKSHISSEPWLTVTVRCDWRCCKMLLMKKNIIY